MNEITLYFVHIGVILFCKVLPCNLQAQWNEMAFIFLDSRDIPLYLFRTSPPSLHQTVVDPVSYLVVRLLQCAGNYVVWDRPREGNIFNCVCSCTCTPLTSIKHYKKVKCCPSLALFKTWQYHCGSGGTNDTLYQTNKVKQWNILHTFLFILNLV